MITTTHHRVDLPLGNAPLADDPTIPSPISGLRISYVNGVPSVLSIDGDTAVYLLRPADLTQADSWPAWLRELVEQHRSTA